MTGTIHATLRWPMDKVIPTYKKGEPRTCAQWLIEHISSQSKDMNNYHSYSFYLTRLEALALPFFLGADTFILTGVFIESLFNRCLWYNGQHRAPHEELLRLCGTITALFYEMIFITFSVLFPSLLLRDPPAEPDKTAQQIEIERLNQESAGKTETITRLEEEKKALESQKAEKEQEIEHLKQEGLGKTETITRLEEEKKALDQQIREKDQTLGELRGEITTLKDAAQKAALKNIYNSLPLFSAQSLETFNKYIQDHEISGIEVSQKDYSGPIPDFKTWGMSVDPQKTEVQLKLDQKESYSSPFEKLQAASFTMKELDEPLKFLEPDGMCTMHLNFSLVEQEFISSILDRAHKVDRLVIENFSVETILKASETGALSKVHTLTLKGEKVNVSELIEIAKRFPNIACFDLREIKQIDGDINRLFSNHIVLAKGKINVREKYEELNKLLFDNIKEYTQEKARDFYMKFKGPDSIGLFHPAAPFMTNIRFLIGVPIREAVFKELAPRLKHCFPNMRTLNLSKCSRLAVNNLLDIADLNIKKLYMIDCEMITYKRETRPPDLEYDAKGVSFSSPQLIMTGVSTEPAPLNSYTLLTSKDGKTKHYYTKPKGKGEAPQIHCIANQDKMGNWLYFLINEAKNEEPIIRYKQIKDSDAIRVYQPSNSFLIYGLNRIFEQGCDEIDMRLTVVDYKSMQEVVHTTIDELKVRGEVKITYAISEEGKIVNKEYSASAPASSATSPRKK